MSEDRPPQGIAAAAVDMCRQVAGALPASFLFLVILNIVFMGMILWFLNTQVEQRTAIVGRVLDVCVLRMQHDQ